MDIARFDTRRYETVSAADGYGEWARTYEDTVLDLMDLRLFEQLRTVPWNQARHAADLACGTGRIGVWLARQGVDAIDGVDLTPEMLELAHSKGIYRRLQQSDVPSYAELGGRLAWNVSDKVALTLSGSNLLHDRHVEYPGGDAIARKVLVGVEWRP